MSDADKQPRPTEGHATAAASEVATRGDEQTAHAAFLSGRGDQASTAPEWRPGDYAEAPATPGGGYWGGMANREPSTADVSAARFLEEASRKHANVTAKEYVRAHLLPHIGPALQQSLGKLHFALPERLAWGDSDLSFPLEVLGRLDDVFGGDAFHGLPELLAPADLWALVDDNRMITDANLQLGDLYLPAASQAALKHGGKGPIGWREGVGVAIASRFAERLGESVPRMAARYLAAFDALAAARPVASSDLIPSHPMDRLVARALCRDGMIHARPAGGRASTTTAAHRKPRRIEALTWVRDPGLWNWVQVTEPADATAEEVAYHLWHDYAAASRLEVHPPFFGLTVEDASHFPEARAHQTDAVARELDPARASQLRAHLTHDPATGDRGAQLAARSTAAASTQSARVAPGAEATTIDEAAAAPADAAHAYRAVVEQLDAITRLVAPLGLAGELAPVRFRAALKEQQLATAPAALAGRELTIAAAQRAVLLEISEPLAQLASQLRVRTGAHTAVASTGAPHDAALAAVASLVHAAALSETAEIAEAALVGAMAQQRLVATDALEAMLAAAMQKIDGVRLQLGSATTPDTADPIALDHAGSLGHQVGRSQAVFGAGLEARHAALHARVEAVRARFLAGEPVAPAELRQLFDEADALRFEAEILADLGGVTALLPTLDALGDSGFHELLAVDSKALDVAGGPGLAHLRRDNHLDDLRGTGVEIAGELRGAHARWLAAVAAIDETYDDEPRSARIARAATELARIRADLDELAHDDQVVAYFRRAYAAVDDEAQRQKIARIAVFIGIAIVATAVGNAAGDAVVVSGAESALLTEVAAIAAETLTNATLTAAVNGGNYKEEIVANAAATLVTVGSLRMAGELFDAARAARALAGAEQVGLGARAAELSIHAGLTAISAVAGMQVDDAIRGGHGLSVDQLDAQSTHALALMIGHTVGTRILARPLAHLRFAGPRGHHLAQRYRALADRAHALEASRSPAEAHALLAEERALYTDEIALLTDLSLDPKSLHAAHLDAANVDGLIADTATARADLDRSSAAHLGGAELHALEPATAGVEVQPGATTSQSSPAIDRVLALDPHEGARLVQEYGDALTDYLHTNPLTTIKELESALSKERARVKDRVRGFYEGIDPQDPPAGWTFDSTEFVDPYSDKVIRTVVRGPNGAEGYFERAYDPRDKVLELRMAFLRMNGKVVGVPSVVAKQSDSVEMLDGKGSPTVQYITLYQMKRLGVAPGNSSAPGVEKIHMHDIQNVETIIHLHYLRNTIGGEVSDLLEHTASIQYADTTAIQTGYERVEPPFVYGGRTGPIEEVLEFQENGNAIRRQQHDKILAKYGYARDTEMFWGFDIDLLVRPRP